MYNYERETENSSFFLFEGVDFFSRSCIHRIKYENVGKLEKCSSGLFLPRGRKRLPSFRERELLTTGTVDIRPPWKDSILYYLDVRSPATF